MSKKQKTWKQIEESRNRRLWVTGVGIPIAGMLISLYVGVPEVRQRVNEIPYKAKKGIAHLKNKFHKKE